MEINNNIEPDLSVIVPAYNMENYIERCLDSLIRQSEINVEIIVVNDGSTDRTGEIIRKYSTNYGFVKIIEQENQGSYKTRINGLKAVNAEYVSFCDADDFIDEDFYGEMLAKMKQMDADVLQFGYRKIDKGITKWEFKPAFEQITGEEAVTKMFETTLFSNANWNKIYKKELFRSLSFDENVRANDEDKLINVKTILKARKVVSLPIVGYNYDTREGSNANSGGLKGIAALNTDNIIYKYVRDNLSCQLIKSAGYDYCGRMAYWYNRCMECGDKARAIDIKRTFFKVYKDSKLRGYVPPHGSWKRILMVHSLAFCPPLCKMMYILYQNRRKGF